MHSLSSDHLNRHCTWIASNPANFPQTINQKLKTMTARYPVFVEQAHIEIMNELISLMTQISQTEKFQTEVFRIVPEIAQHSVNYSGVLFGYDFHISDDGPKLIEINTNAGAIFLNHYLNQSQQACCDSVLPLMDLPIYKNTATSKSTTNTDLNASLLHMFKHEFSKQYPDRKLRTIAIMDEDPESQFLLDEFLMFKKLFEAAGINTFIVDPKELSTNQNGLDYQGHQIDLIYNRHTDFYLEAENLDHIKHAYLHNKVILTPSPHAYATAADKRLLAFLSDEDFLTHLGLNEDQKRLLLKTIPKTELLSDANKEKLWKNRKQYFFKPITGHGSKATYAGAKLTKKTWNEQILTNDYIAQAYVQPSRRQFEMDGESREFKVDLRNYVYEGDTLLLAARLYRGQATNMRTLGGGFATVYATNH